MHRCSWAGTDPVYIDYHDREWGVPMHDERTLFEMLVLDGAQAGLSWITILKKRDNYRAAFDNFDAAKMARYSGRKVQALLNIPASCAIASRSAPRSRMPRCCCNFRSRKGVSLNICGVMWTVSPLSMPGGAARRFRPAPRYRTPSARI